MAAMQLTRTHRILIAIVVTGAVIIAGIGFAGSYAAVRDLAERKGFGDFALVFPIGIDAGICVLLALDLLLTWMRIPFPLLRQTAWLLTIATIAFNGAASWPDPLGVGMHAVIPVLFVVSVEAARHAVGRIADITADKHMEGVRLTRWLLSPVPTFKLWRRMKLWELRSYEQVIKLEQDRLIYQARLQARFGRAWRRKAPIEALMPLRLAKYGVPLSETAAAGLAAAGVEPALLPPAPAPAPRQQPELVRESPKPPSLSKEPAEPGRAQLPPGREQSADAGPAGVPVERREASRQWAEEEWREEDLSPEYDEYGAHAPDPEESQGSPWFARQAQDVVYEGGYDPSYPADTRIADPDAPQVPTGSGDRMRPLGDPSRRPEPPRRPSPEPQPEPEQLAEEVREFYEAAYPVFVTLSHELSDYPKAEHLDIHLADVHGITHPDSAALLRQAMPAFKQRIQTELVDDHIA